MNGPSKPINIPQKQTTKNELAEDGMTSDNRVYRSRTLEKKPSEKLMETDIIGELKFTKIREQISTLFKNGCPAPEAEENTKVEELGSKSENKI